VASVLRFKALRPPHHRAEAIASVPYDVINSSEAAALAEGKPWSFLHVIRPEIDLPPETDLYSEPVYQQARQTLERFLSEAPYSADAPCMMIYRLVLDGRAQVGVVAACSVDEYDDGRIAIHERTRQAKEDDRTRHVLTMRCQAEPIFLAYRAVPHIDDFVEEVLRSSEPEVDFVAEDGVQHSLWTVPDPGPLEEAFEAVPRLYVADGHHRTKSASRARAALKPSLPELDGDHACDRVMAVVFPDSQLRILAYNRVVTDLGGRSPAQVLAELQERFVLEPTESAEPQDRNSFCVYADGSWYRFGVEPTGSGTIERLDVSLLQEQVLEPLFGIADPRTDPRIDFVGGSRGTRELERRAEASGGVAFSLHPTSLAELFAVADAGEIMPPKSTWFEPKLRSGLFVHRI